jgi:hypothetical protein
MLYVKNLPGWERLLRLGAGLALAIFAVMAIGGVAGWLGGMAGAGLALTGLVGFCPACALAGRRLERHVFGLDPLDETKAERWLAKHTDTSLRLDLAHALESLPEHYRAIILLRDFEERSIAEIAAANGQTIAATKSRLHRARQLMREYLLA